MNASDPAPVLPAFARPKTAARLAASLLLAALASACAMVRPPPPANPFVGVWSTGEKQQIAFRNETVVMTAPGEGPTPLSAATCDGTFRFGYSREPRGSLVGLALRQPDLQRQLADQLNRPDYAVAEVTCGEGGTVYVLLDDHTVLAIHRDRDVIGVERLTRA